MNVFKKALPYIFVVAFLCVGWWGNHFYTRPREIVHSVNDFDRLRVQDFLINDEEVHKDLYKIFSKYRMHATSVAMEGYIPDNQEYVIDLWGHEGFPIHILLGEENRVYSSGDDFISYRIINQEALIQELDDYFETNNMYVHRFFEDGKKIDAWHMDNDYFSRSPLVSIRMGEHAFLLYRSDFETESLYTLFLITNEELTVKKQPFTKEQFIFNNEKYSLEMDGDIFEYTAIYARIPIEYQTVVVEDSNGEYVLELYNGYCMGVIKELEEDYIIYAVDDEGTRVEVHDSKSN